MTSWIVVSAASYVLSNFMAGQTSLKINVVHAIPGRVRLQCNRWKNPQVTVVLEEILDTHPLVKQCSASSITGSLLLEFTKDHLTEDEFNQILKCTVDASVDGFKQKEADVLTIMKKAVKGVDGVVKSRTQGTIDVKSLIVSGLLIKGLLDLRKSPAEGSRNLLWAYRFIAGEGVKR